MPRVLPQTFAAFLAMCSSTLLAAEPAPGGSPATLPADMIRTPPAPATPRINGPRVYGARPGHPFYYHLPVTGERPITFAADGLPVGLTLDANTGNITGTTTESGTHPVGFTATNARGTDKTTLSVVIGDTICLTPPLGWNSWNHFAGRVSETDVRGAADAMVSSGLIDHGWTYVNVDDCWQAGRDADGNIEGNHKFPDLKGLADYVHSKGLKFGTYSSPGPKTCAGFTASYQHEDQDARTYAGWGVDYVKYDLCSYGGIIREHVRQRTAALLTPEQQPRFDALARERDTLQNNRRRNPDENARLKDVDAEIGQMLAPLDQAKIKEIRLDEEQIPYRVFQQSLAKVPRDIVYSFCQYGNGDSWTWAPAFGANSWRTTGDISANWKSMTNIGFKQGPLAKYAGPGHWNDPDMLEVGNKGLTPDECYTHMTLWCMLSSPLLIGCDMSQMDPLTVSMFSNDEVLAVNQDALGKQGYRLKAEGTSEVWVKPLADGSLAVALFNRGDAAADVNVSWAELKSLYKQLEVEPTKDLPGLPKVHDLWRQKDQRPGNAEIRMSVASHGAELVRISSRVYAIN